MKISQQIIAVVMTLAISPLLSSVLYASTAANTTITNIVTVNYEDAANQAQTPETASVDITVSLVASIPLVSSPADVGPTTENTAVNLVYTITSTANGLDTYNFTSVDTPSGMDANAGFTTPSITTLGGTTLAAAASASDTFIVVPYDGASDNNVNGIIDGDTIVVNGVTYTVGTIDEAGTLSNNTVQIPITDVGGISAADIVGQIVGEQDTVTVTVTTDSITTGTSGTHSVVTTATSATAPNPAGLQSTATVITVERPVLVINKYVRNTTNAAANPGGVGDYVFDGVDWFATGVNGATNDVMEYLIVVDNSGVGSKQANNIVISDPIPQFTTFDAVFNTRLDADGTAASIAAFSNEDETADDGDAAELDTTGNGTIYVYAGVGGDDTTAGAGNGAGGSLAVGEFSRVIFRVSID
jgi:hypothetical protein